jgi:hypothetical protein
VDQQKLSNNQDTCGQYEGIRKHLVVCMLTPYAMMHVSAELHSMSGASIHEC